MGRAAGVGGGAPGRGAGRPLRAPGAAGGQALRPGGGQRPRRACVGRSNRVTPWQPDPPPDPGPRRLEESLDRLAHGIGGPNASALGGVFTRWAEVVGDEVAAHAAPVSLASGTLVVS